MEGLLSNGALIADLLIILLLAVFLLLGIIKGFASIFVSFIAKIIIAIISIMLGGVIVRLLENSFSIVTNLGNSMAEPLTGFFGADMMNLTLESFRNGEYSVVSGGIAALFLGVIVNNLIGESVSATLTLGAIVPKTLAYYIILIISAIVLYIIFRIILSLFKKFLTSLTQKITVVRWVDKLLGAVLYSIVGYLVVCFVVYLLEFIPLEFMTSVMDSVKTSSIGSIVYNNNLVAVLLPLLGGIGLNGILAS